MYYKLLYILYNLCRTFFVFFFLNYELVLGDVDEGDNASVKGSKLQRHKILLFCNFYHRNDMNFPCFQAITYNLEPTSL